MNATLALATAVTGNSAVLLAAAGDAAPSLAPWLQGGGSAAAVAGLVYVARMIVKGDLVPRSVASRELETTAAIRIQGERESKYVELLSEAHGREIVLAQLSNDMARTVGELSALLRDANARGDSHGPRRD